MNARPLATRHACSFLPTTRSALVLLLVATPAGVGAGDREALVGTWRIDVFQDDGRDRLDRLAAGPAKKGQPPRVARLVITADDCRITRGDGTRESRAGLANAAWKSFTLDDTADPEGDVLTICWCEQGRIRPTKLESDGANNLLRCTRESNDD